MLKPSHITLRVMLLSCGLLILFCKSTQLAVAQTNTALKLVTRETVIANAPAITSCSYDDFRFVASSDNRHLAWWCPTTGPDWVVVVNGVRGKVKTHNGQAPPVFSPDGKRLAYRAYDGGGGCPAGCWVPPPEKWFAVVNGAKGKEYNGISHLFSARMGRGSHL